MSIKNSKKTVSKQQLIWNFTVKKSDLIPVVRSEPKLKRNYEDVVSELLTNAREIFKARDEREKNRKNQSLKVSRQSKESTTNTL